MGMAEIQLLDPLSPAPQGAHPQEGLEVELERELGYSLMWHSSTPKWHPNYQAEWLSCPHPLYQ